MGEKMTLEQVRDRMRAKLNMRNGAGSNDLADWINALDAHLTQPAQACVHDWAVGYGVPAYCNHCGVERNPKPAQAVDVDSLYEVIRSFGYTTRGQSDEIAEAIHHMLTAALPNANGKEG